MSSGAGRAATRRSRSTRPPRTPPSRCSRGVADGGEGFTVVSEEVGERSFGGGGRWRVVIDPIDGSLNAKRGLPLYALSVAVADGPSMADVALGYVYDLGNGEEWIARRGGGATVDGAPLGASRPLERLQIVALEATRPEHLAPRRRRAAGRGRARARAGLARARAVPPRGRPRSTRSRACGRTARARSTSRPAQLAMREAGSAIALPDAAGPVRRRAARPRRALARRGGARRRLRRARRRAARHRLRGRLRSRSGLACRREQPRLRRAPDRARAGHRPRDPAQRRRARDGRRGRRRRRAACTSRSG